MKIKHTYKHTSTSIKNAFKLILNGHYRIFLKEFMHRLYSRTYSFGLKRDLHQEFKKPTAEIDITIRLLKDKDVPLLLRSTPDNPVNPRIIANQQAMVDANIPTCYVAATKDDKPTYMQWLIGYEQRDLIAKHFKGIFPELKKSEALLEGAFGNPEYRGLKIMPEAMSVIAEKAKEINARWVITFVDTENVPSLKGCKRSGFEPYVLRKYEWFFFWNRVSFHPLPKDLLEDYYQQMENGTKKSSKRKDQTVNKQIKSLEKV